MRRYFVLSLFGLLLLITAACSESAATLPADAQGAGEAPLSALTLANFRARPNLPSQLQFLFSLRDQNGDPLTAAPDELQVQISERGGGAEAWEEIDPETGLLLHTVRNIQLEAVFVLDFTYSIARVVLSDGTDGTKTMADAFRSGATALPGPHRIGVVEFHDRNADPVVVSTLTTDRDTLISSVDDISVDSGSSRLWDSIAEGVSLFSSSLENPNLVKTLVFMSDGRDNSSDITREESGKIAVDNGVQLYAVGIGAVFEETQLADMVRSSGGAYYSAPNLESLFRDQLGRLIDDLLGQYMASYISLRPEGSHSVRVQVSVQGTTAAFHTQPVEFSSFYGPDTQGILAFDPPAISEVLGQATVYARALHVPRNIARFRFRHTSEGPMDVKLVPRDGGGLLEGWQLSGPDGLGYYDVSSTSPLAFWDFGVLFKLVMPWVTGDASEIPVEFDNSIYTAGKSFIYPPYPDDVDILGYRESVQVVVSEADIEVEGDLEFLSSLY